MKKGIRVLKVIERMLDVEDFYSITVDGQLLNLQGKYKAKIVRLLIDNKFVSKDNINGFIVYQRYNVQVVLTD